MNKYDTAPVRHYLRHQVVTPRSQFAPASFRHPRPMTRAHPITKLLIAVIGIAVFATVGVLAGFIER